MDLSKTCRLCLKTGDMMTDIFCFSYEMIGKIANVIMMCAPVKIWRNDQKPKFICPSCFIELKKVHRFQMQAIESDRILENSLKKSHASDRQTTSECLIRKPTKELVNQNSDRDIAIKSELSEVMNRFADGVDSKEKVRTKSDATNQTIEESTDLYPNTEYFDNSKVNSEKLETFNADENTEENFLNFEICDVQIKEEPAEFINTKYTHDTLASTEINFDDTITNINTSEKSEFRWAVEEADFFCKNADDSLIYRQEKSVRNKTSTRKKMNKCDVCNKCFAKPQTLHWHKIIHTGEKPHRCDVCDKGFNRRNDLKQHKLLHTGEKPYQCDVCYKCFNKKSNLKTHRMLHSDDKPFKCDVCNKGYVQLKYLKIHQLQHTGEKPYQCDICSKGFTEACHLKVHQRLHTGEKPYICDVCDKSYIQLSSLKYHKLKHTDENSH